MNSNVYINGTRATDSGINSFLINPLSVHAFETLIVSRGVIFRREEHLNRLWQSAKTIGISVQTERKELERELILIAKKCVNVKTCIRIMVTEHDRIIWTFERALPKKLYREGIHLTTGATRRAAANASFPEAKSNQFLNGILSLLDSQDERQFETLMLDQNGHVKEARVWNLFIVKRNGLRTPASDGILNGVTRNFVIECAQKEGIPVLETALTRHEVWNANEAFLTNTSGAILPVASLDSRKVGNSMPGKITKQLSKRYELEFAKEIRVIARSEATKQSQVR